MDGRAWWAVVYGVGIAKSRTRLSNTHTHTHTCIPADLKKKKNAQCESCELNFMWGKMGIAA